MVQARPTRCLGWRRAGRRAGRARQGRAASPGCRGASAWNDAGRARACASAGDGALLAGAAAPGCAAEAPLRAYLPDAAPGPAHQPRRRVCRCKPVRRAEGLLSHMQPHSHLCRAPGWGHTAGCAEPRLRALGPAQLHAGAAARAARLEARPMAKPVASSASSRYRSRTGNVRPGIASAPTAPTPSAPRPCRAAQPCLQTCRRRAGLLRSEGIPTR